jgi:FkbM family methyltransferase
MPAQKIYNLILNSPPNTFLNKLGRLIRSKLMFLLGDKLINYKIRSLSMLMPFSHDLPLYLQLIPTYSQNLAPIAKIICKKYANAGCIDIGANIGDSALFIKEVCDMPIICIEGNPYYLSILEKNVSRYKDISICAQYVGTGEETVEAQNHDGSAHLTLSNSGQKTQTLNQLLNSVQNIVSYKLIKIDTDGFDNKIIRSSSDFIQQHTPIIFFEYDTRFLLLQNENPTDVFALLANLGYDDLILFDNKGYYILKVNSRDSKNLHSLTQYILKSKGTFYLDICAIHKSDGDIAQEIINHFTKE